MKRKISLMLTIILIMQILLPMLSVIVESKITIRSIAVDEQEATIDGITWVYTLSNGEATNVKPKYKSNLPQEVTIPNSLDGYTVTSIGNNAFEGCSNLKRITIPEGVTTIGDDAFDSCKSLTSIEIPAGVTSIGNNAFFECTSLTSMIIPEGLTSIGIGAFNGCTNLTSIEIPAGVTSIGYRAFGWCRSLNSIIVAENNNNYSSVGEVLFNKNKTQIIQYPGGKAQTTYIIPEGVTNIERFAFEGCSSLASINIPGTVTSMGYNAFEGCSSLTSINIPEGVTDIEEYEFAGCVSLTSIIIPEGVTSIGYDAFLYCTSLKNIEIPSSVTNIEDAFYGCSSLKNINVEENNNNYSSIDGVLFNKDKTQIIKYPEGKTQTTYIIPEGITWIESSAFSGCSNLTSIKIPEGVRWIGASAFFGCSSLASINIPGTVTSIRGQVFGNCTSLTSINIPEGVTSIGNLAFEKCTSLTSIIIPEGVTSIEYCAFHGCSSLASINIPGTVTSIGYSAFEWCRSLNSITVAENNNNYSSIDGVLFNKDKTEIIKYPEGKTQTTYIIPEGVTSIGKYSFENCISLISIVIPEGVTSIEKYAFYGDNSLTIYCKDNSVAKQYAIDKKIKYEIDETAPVIENIRQNPENWSTENVTLVINASDSLSGLAKEAYSFDGGITWQEGNSKTYETHENVVIKVRDNLGNIAEQNVEVKIDKANPVIESVTGNPENWTNENVTLVVNASDNLSGIANEGYSFDGGATWQEENSKTYEENTNGIVIKVRDKAGNESTYSEEINITKIVLKGDANGDGQVDFNDILTINKHRLGKIELTEERLVAADVTKDGIADFSDILQINKYRLGKISSL